MGGELLDLTSSEFRILHLLARRPGWVFTRQQIIDEAQGEDAAVTSRSVDVHVVAIRRKLGDAKDLIETQGPAVDLGGYYKPDDAKAGAAMRPSKTLNAIVDALAGRLETAKA